MDDGDNRVGTRTELETGTQTRTERARITQVMHERRIKARPERGTKTDPKDQSNNLIYSRFVELLLLSNALQK